MDVLTLVIGALLAIAAATALSARLRIAPPLILVLLGIAISLIPGAPRFELDPEWVLAGVLPPLLYSASVNVPASDFRRDFGAIGSLSVLLVVVSTAVVGLVLHLVLPQVPLPWCIAVGAIVSPTDAVATSIVRKVGVSSRIVTILEGESLLNDATALVLLRSAIAAAAVSVSFWDVAGGFVFSVVVAVLIGWGVGALNLLIRARLDDSAANTILSITAPFLASIPAEHLGASGLVAAVVAGLVTGIGGVRLLPVRHRLSDAQTWRVIELVLEGAIFLTMGLELTTILADLAEADGNLRAGLLIALLVLALTVLVRTVHVGALLLETSRRGRRHAALQERLDVARGWIADPEGAAARITELHDRAPGPVSRAVMRRRIPRNLEDFRARVVQMGADLDYFLSQPLGWREGGIVVWAGMRGAVTLAAAQTLPADTPERSLLVFIAFAVAAVSLLLQGATLGPVIRVLNPRRDDPARVAQDMAALGALMEGVRQAAEGSGSSALEVIEAQRAALLAEGRSGAHVAAALERMLAALDADQIRLELRSEPAS